MRGIKKRASKASLALAVQAGRTVVLLAIARKEAAATAARHKNDTSTTQHMLLALQMRFLHGANNTAVLSGI
jgi:hypothetical protein